MLLCRASPEAVPYRMWQEPKGFGSGPAQSPGGTDDEPLQLVAGSVIDGRNANATTAAYLAVAAPDPRSWVAPTISTLGLNWGLDRRRSYAFAYVSVWLACQASERG